MKLSLVISNRNDTVMLALTVRSAIEELRPLGFGNFEIIIVDNSDAAEREKAISCIPSGYIQDKTVKIVQQDFPCLFSARELGVSSSSSDYIGCVDSHVLFGRDSFIKLVDFLDRHKDDTKVGFVHAPIVWAHHHERTSKHDRDMSKHELGDWGVAHLTESKMSWKGMPWICRRSLWSSIGGYGALSKHKLSWGGGDMHIGIKPWLLGFENWAVPTTPVIHIGPFPMTNPDKRSVSPLKSNEKYRLYAKSGSGPTCLGFLVSCYILGGESMMLRNKPTIVNKFGKYLNVEAFWTRAMELGEVEKSWIDERKVISFEDLLQTHPWKTEVTPL